MFDFLFVPPEPLTFFQAFVAYLLAVISIVGYLFVSFFDIKRWWL